MHAQNTAMHTCSDHVVQGAVENANKRVEDGLRALLMRFPSYT